MKRLLVLVMVMALSLSGCALFKSTLCNQKADEIAAISQQIADAADSLAFLQTLIPTAPVLAMIAGLKLTIATLNQMRNGYCATPEQTAAIRATIGNAQLTQAQVKAGIKPTVSLK